MEERNKKSATILVWSIFIVNCVWNNFPMESDTLKEVVINLYSWIHSMDSIGRVVPYWSNGMPVLISMPLILLICFYHSPSSTLVVQLIYASIDTFIYIKESLKCANCSRQRVCHWKLLKFAFQARHLAGLLDFSGWIEWICYINKLRNLVGFHPSLFVNSFKLANSKKFDFLRINKFKAFQLPASRFVWSGRLR